MDEIKKQLVADLKNEGLEVTEDIVMKLFKVLFPYIGKIALMTDNKLDDLLVPLLAVLEPQIVSLIDKIDGAEG